MTNHVQSTHAKARGEEADKKLAPLLDNSIAWGGFVASRRRQLVNGSEERALIRDCPFLTLHTNVKNNWHSGWDFLPVNRLYACVKPDCPVLDIPLLC